MEIEEDYWADEDFEDHVARALIVGFESKIIRNKGIAKWDNLNHEVLNMIRSTGLYIPSNSRIIVDPQIFFWDFINDPAPLRGCVSFIPNTVLNTDYKDAYLTVNHIRKVKKFSSKYWHKKSPGLLYEFFSSHARNSGIEGERRYFTLTKNGEIFSCYERLQDVFGYAPGRKINIITSDQKYLDQTKMWASFTMQFIADSRFCWSITAQEETAKATIGCMKEEIKSLLYARDLPMTSTGRKRPILHLVEAHKRRIRLGIDIDVTSFLRGVRTVEIGNTKFTVNPPFSIKDNLSINSQKNYFTPWQAITPTSSPDHPD
jgi:hypothetical protein